MDFKEWLEAQGCQVKVIQEDDGSGFDVLEVTIPEPDSVPVQMSVNKSWNEW